MSDYMEERVQKTKIYGEYDVVVCGGGIAGIAAALAAARSGAKTVLLEAQYMLGGLATAGLVTIYLPLCDGKGHQLSYGIAEELLRLSVSVGGENTVERTACYKAWLGDGTEEERKKARFEVQYNPNVFAILAEQLLLKEGVEILYGASVVSATLGKDRKLKAIAMETREGRFAILGKSFIDATGDAALYRVCEQPLAKFEFGNALSWWYYELIDGKNTLRLRGARDIDSVNRKYKDGIDGVGVKELSTVTAKGHALILEDFLKRGSASNTHALTMLPVIPQVRMTRRIYGLYEMTREGDDKKYFEDSVGMFGDWTTRGPAYELPFSALHDGKIKNLACAGRCISAKDDIWELTRVIPVCAVSGEAVGVAAAMTDDLTTLDVKELQTELKKRNVKLHLEEVGLTAKYLFGGKNEAGIFRGFNDGYGAK